MTTQEKILFVDDDELLLAAMQRSLGRQYSLVTAAGAETGLARLTQEKFAVIVSDLRMPGMDGITFLIKTRELSPDSTRVLLTGNPDLSVAIDAINESHIFRFLIKPVLQPVLIKALDAGLAQYRLVVAERELLSKTLVGSVQILTDMLRHVYPEAAQISQRVRNRARALAEQLHLPDVWQYELAALLSQIGLVMAPPALLSKLQRGEPLTAREQGVLAEYISKGRNLLRNIPRLEPIADMIGKQQQEFPRSLHRVRLQERDNLLLGAQILQIAAHFEQFYAHYHSEQHALLHMYHQNRYDPLLLDALRETVAPAAQRMNKP